MERQKLVDRILEAARSKMNEEISGLLGVRIITSKLENRVITKAGFFESVDKIVLAKIDVSGDQQGQAFLALSLKDAILLGGTLIMLPEAELEKHVAENIFGEDEADSFGEIANIITGVYSACFDEQFPQKLHLARLGLEVISSAQVKIDSSSPFPEQLFYMSSFSMKMDGRQLGDFQILFPVELLGIDAAELQPVQPMESPPSTEPATQNDPAAKQRAGRLGSPQTDKALQTEEEQIDESSCLVLVLAEKVEEGRVVAETIQDCGYTVQLLGFTDNVKEAILGEKMRGVFLVMSEVSEKGIAAIIKARSSCGGPVPVIAAGPQWTRKTVLQAIKYGACDIVITPSQPDEIREKVNVHLRTPPS